MLLWLAYRAWNPFCDLQGDYLGRRGTFLSCDFGLPRTGSSSAVHSGSMDFLRPSSDTSSSSAWTLGLEWNGPKPVEPSGPTIMYEKKRINHLMHFENKHIYCTLLISYYLHTHTHTHTHTLNNTLVSHNMNLLYNLKVKYLFIFII